MDDYISRQAAIDAVRDRMGKGETHIGDTFIECFEMILKALPSAQPEQNYCRDCKWSHCHINVDKHGKTEMYWRCLNWDGETEEEGYCHEWERRTDESD